MWRTMPEPAAPSGDFEVAAKAIVDDECKMYYQIKSIWEDLLHTQGVDCTQ